MDAGRFLAVERGAFDVEAEAVPPVLGADRRSQIIERLNQDSLSVVAELMSLSLFELSERYR